MIKNTTQTGSFFDPMPSQLFGNIKQMNNPTETVIGYVGVYTTEQSIFFILEADLPPGDVAQHRCEQDVIQFPDTEANRESYFGGSSPAYVPYQLISDPLFPSIIAMPRVNCMDCRSDVTGPRPDFW